MYLGGVPFVPLAALVVLGLFCPIWEILRLRLQNDIREGLQNDMREGMKMLAIRAPIMPALVLRLRRWVVRPSLAGRMYNPPPSLRTNGGGGGGLFGGHGVLRGVYWGECSRVGGWGAMWGCHGGSFDGPSTSAVGCTSVLGRRDVQPTAFAQDERGEGLGGGGG